MKLSLILLAIVLIAIPLYAQAANVDADAGETVKVEDSLEGAKIPSKTDDEVVDREEETSSDTFSVSEQKIIKESAKKHEFQAEVNKLMGIIINSLYYNNEVFLRELISNASDALDKIRYLSLTDKEQLAGNPDLQINIKADPVNNILHITDSGVGMTEQELVANLGTIAQSGTREFLQKLKDSGDSSLIGQFGVGFYSAFLVAEEVTVTTKSNDSEDQMVWQSTSDSSFTISKDPRGNTLGRGTRISLKLKEDAAHFLQQETVSKLVNKYNSFINFPIYMWASEEVEREVPIEPEEDAEEPADETEETEESEEEEEAEDVEVEDEEEEEDEEDDEPKTKTIKETVWDWKLLNDTKPIWVRNKDDISTDEYNEFYKQITKDNDDPLTHIHFNAEGEIEFKALLYVPSKAPADLFQDRKGKDGEEQKSLKLYVRKVFITDDFESIIPKWLSFVKGVIDSDDLPLNVSRETLQQHKTLKIIQKKLVRKAIAMIQELAQAEDREEFNTFWKNFGTAIKLGMIEDTSNRTRLSKLMMFTSSTTGELTTFDDYIERMKEGQTQIYFLGGENLEQIKKSPLLERLEKRGFEVLYMTEPIDEYALQNLPKYDGKYPVTNIAKEDMKVDGESVDDDKLKETEEGFAGLISFMSREFSAGLEKVVISSRLTTSPCALVSGQFGYTANMQRILKAQALGGAAAHQPKAILEINPRHPIVKELNSLVEADEESEKAKITARVLYETAVLSSGFQVDDTARYAEWIHKMMSINLNLDPEAEFEQEDDFVDIDPVEVEGEGEESDEEEEEEVEEVEVDTQVEEEAEARDEL